MKEFIQGMYQKTHFTKRLIAVILSVIVMGFALSWLVLVDLGTDPCTSMNLAISHKLGMSIGNWQALFNSFLFLRDPVVQGKYRIWNPCQYVFGGIFTRFLFLAVGKGASGGSVFFHGSADRCFISCIIAVCIIRSRLHGCGAWNCTIRCDPVFSIEKIAKCTIPCHPYGI